MTRLAILATLALVMPLTVSAQHGPGSHFIENWDLDQNGSVSLDEITQRRGDVFDMFDQDENGSLDAAEYALFDETRAADMQNNAVGHGKGGHRMQQGLTLAFNDTNGDGAVSRDEFIANSSAWLAQADRDGDGVISAADFGSQGN